MEFQGTTGVIDQPPMPDLVTWPPDAPPQPDGSKLGGWWHRQDDGRIVCDLCPRTCRERGIRSVAVTAGYITPDARAPFFEIMDAANVDLKGFTEPFYQKYTLAHLQPVLETLRWLKHESVVWFEITNLIIPRAND